MAAEKEKRVWFIEDESIFSLKPYTARGWYPTGPAIHVPLTFERSSRFYAFGVANGKKEHYCFYDSKNKKNKNKKKNKQRNIDAAMTISFLSYLHKQYPKLLLIWDGAPNHRAKKVCDYAKNHNIKMLWFPTACPEENPLEQSWDFLKSTTANTHYPTITDYKKAAKKQANKKNLAKMFKYLTH